MTAMSHVLNNYLRKTKSFSIHHQNFHRLLIEMYKACNNISENTFSQLFAKRNSNLNLRSKTQSGTINTYS